MDTILLSLGKDGIGPHEWPMQNPEKTSCYGQKIQIFTMEHDLGHDNEPWCTKPLNMIPRFNCMPYISYAWPILCLKAPHMACKGQRQIPLIYNLGFCTKLFDGNKFPLYSMGTISDFVIHQYYIIFIACEIRCCVVNMWNEQFVNHIFINF